MCLRLSACCVLQKAPTLINQRVCGTFSYIPTNPYSPSHLLQTILLLQCTKKMLSDVIKKIWHGSWVWWCQVKWKQTWVIAAGVGWLEASVLLWENPKSCVLICFSMILLIKERSASLLCIWFYDPTWGSTGEGGEHITENWGRVLPNHP